MRAFTLQVLFISFLGIQFGFSQQQEIDPFDVVISENKFRMKPALMVGWASPQKIGAEASLYLGMFKKEYYPNRPAPLQREANYAGINLAGSAYTGGFKAGIYYFNLTSYIGAAGYRLGAAYYYNNENAGIRKSTELVGLEFDLYVVFAMRFGILRDLYENKYVPTLGFSLPIGPKMNN